MKNKFITILGMTMLVMLPITNASAVSITGNIGFTGSAQLNTGNAQTASEVVSWMNTVVGASSGSFTVLGQGTPVLLKPGWMLNSGPLNNFWTVGGFTFNLVSSTIYSQNATFLNVLLSGTVTGNGYSPTDFTGSFQVGNPAADGMTSFTERLSFTSAAPDGGATVILLGLTCLGLAGIKRKYPHILGLPMTTGHET